MSPLYSQTKHNTLPFRASPQANGETSRREGASRKPPKPMDPRSRRETLIELEELRAARRLGRREAMDFLMRFAAVFAIFFLFAYILQTADQILNAYTPEAAP